MRKRTRTFGTVAVSVILVAATALAFGKTRVPPAHVLRVGTFNNIPGTYTSVQAAVLAAQPGDWVLVAPGDYKENGYTGSPEPAGVLIATPGVHLRGMNRNTVVIDGTVPGSPTCSPAKADQIFTDGGRDGIIALKVDNVSIENLTVCNYLTGNSGGEGNEIWWNGGDGSGTIGMGPFYGGYLTATSTYSNGTDHPRGEYGIFTSNSKGPGLIEHTYASNMGDAAYYIGACPDCNQILDDALGQFSALGFSGTNAGGHLIIRNSTFSHNKSGAAPDSQNNDDAPSPLDGRCPDPNETSPISGTNSCTIWMNNTFDSNNEPNVPGSGSGLAGSSPVGSGLVLAGARYFTLINNTFKNNNSWGLLIADLPDQENPPTDIGQNCQGGISVIPPGLPVTALCYFQAFGNDVRDNTFVGNGSYGNPTNGDIALVTTPHLPGNCFSGNTDPAGLTSDPPAILLQSPLYACGMPNAGDMTLGAIEALCATELVFPCPDTPITHYPRAGQVVLSMAPAQPTMPNPCLNVPANPWCPGGSSSMGFGAGGPLVSTIAVIPWMMAAAGRRRRPFPTTRGMR